MLCFYISPHQQHYPLIEFNPSWNPLISTTHPQYLVQAPTNTFIHRTRSIVNEVLLMQEVLSCVWGQRTYVLNPKSLRPLLLPVSNRYILFVDVKREMEHKTHRRHESFTTLIFLMQASLYRVWKIGCFAKRSIFALNPSHDRILEWYLKYTTRATIELSR